MTGRQEDHVVAVVTRTRMARLRHVPAFAWASLRAGLQARRTPGFVTGAMGISPGPVFWTLTVWTDGRAMQAFRDSGAHAEAMPRLAGWASEGAFAAWRLRAPGLPGWDEARRRLVERGCYTRLAAPDGWHRAHVVPPTRLGVAKVPLPAARAVRDQADWPSSSSKRVL